MKRKKKYKKDTIGYLKQFIKACEKKYGSKCLDFRVEIHQDNGEFIEPNEVVFVGIAKYPEDKMNGYPAERVLVLK